MFDNNEHVTETVALDSTSLIELHDEYLQANPGLFSLSDFQDFLSTRVKDEGNLPDDVVQCGNDDAHVLLSENGYDTQNHGLVCPDCFSVNFLGCEGCTDYVHSDDVAWTLYDTRICTYCRDYRASYCDDCDGYYLGDDCGGEHYDNCDCEAPHQNFGIPNGDGVLLNDTPCTVELPEGIVDDQGIRKIRTYIWDRVSYIAGLVLCSSDDGSESSIGYETKTDQGSFAKRLSRAIHKATGKGLSPEQLTYIGNIVAQHSQGGKVTFETTRNLNLPAEEFAHEESCWWQSYADSRCILKTNGGFGIRTWAGVRNDDSDRSWVDQRGWVNGRAWVQPVNLVDGRWEPTHDALSADGFVVFNGYGTLSGLLPTRVLAQITGKQYRKVGFELGTAYINNQNGVLLASKEILDAYSDNWVTVRAERHANLPAPDAYPASLNSEELVSA